MVNDTLEPTEHVTPDVLVEPPLWRPALVLPGVLLLALAFAMGRWVTSVAPRSIGDYQFLHWLELHRNPVLTEAALVLDGVGGPRVTPLLTLAIVLLLVLFRRRVLGLVVGLITLLAWLPGHFAKKIFTRPRPPKDLNPVLDYSGPGANSFPSGHTSFVVALVIALAFALGATGHHRRWMLALGGTLVFFVGLARMYLGVHWPTDVLASISFGLGTALLLWPLAAWLYARARRRWPRTA